MLNPIKEQFNRLQAVTSDLYHFLNSFRDWFNGALINYEIYLEDNWFEDKTTIEYTLRCLDTFNILIVAEDEYKNYRDSKGIWHLGEYVKTYWLVENAWEKMEAFIQENTPPRFREEKSDSAMTSGE